MFNDERKILSDNKSFSILSALDFQSANKGSHQSPVGYNRLPAIFPYSLQTMLDLFELIYTSTASDVISGMLE